MNKLMSSLLAATIVGAFSLSAIAADASKATPAAASTPAASAMSEKPADAPKKHTAEKVVAKKHTAKPAVKKSHEAATPAMPAEPAKK